jgi:hypothetical protein
MAKRADFTIEPDPMKGEIDEHGKLREPFVRLPGEPDHWTFYLTSYRLLMGHRVG